MIRVPATYPKALDLAQQKTDFTSEGALVPGKTVAPLPASAGKPKKTASRAPAAVPAARKGSPPSRHRW